MQLVPQHWVLLPDGFTPGDAACITFRWMGVAKIGVFMIIVFKKLENRSFGRPLTGKTGNATGSSRT